MAMSDYDSPPEGGGNFGGAQTANPGDFNYDFGNGSGSPYYEPSPNYSTGQWADPQSSFFNPESAPAAPTFMDSLWDGIKRWGKNQAFNKVAQRAGDAAPLVGPAIAAYNAPKGQGLNAAGNSFGANTLNTILYGINPIAGAANSLYGMFTGDTLGSSVWNAINHGDSSGFNQNTAASGGDPSRSGSHGTVDNFLTGLASMYGARQASRGLNNQINTLTGMYGQDSPYAQTLRQTLARKDAAAGRRSSAGPREVELQARLAELASRNSGAVAGLEGQRNQLNMQKLNSLLYLGRNSGLFSGMQKGLNNWMAQNNNSNYSNEGLNYQTPVDQPVDYNQFIDQQG